MSEIKCAWCHKYMGTTKSWVKQEYFCGADCRYQAEEARKPVIQIKERDDWGSFMLSESSGRK